MKPKELIKAAYGRKCVTGFIGTGTDRIPAAFVIFMPFASVMNALPRMSIYKPRKHYRPKWATRNAVNPPAE